MLSADAFARYCRLRGYETLYICGTDEYGTATETKARQEGITPRELCDQYYAIHKDVYGWFGISCDHFGRTSTPAHTEIVQGVFNALHARRLITQRSTRQLYSESMQLFLADRYVTGTCPNCGYEKARGDQCESCGKLLDPTDLKNPKSVLDGSTPVLKSTTHLYINLPRLLPTIERWMVESGASERWALNATRMAGAWLRSGLQERAITRDLSWGIPVPLKDFERKVFYVWFDAPLGYISITASYTKEWRRWWQRPDEVALYQFMGKDNIPFHAIICPASLLGTGEKWTLPHSISSSEYLNWEGSQFSKSSGIGVFGTDAIESGIPADMWRFYMFYNRPERSDYNFVWKDFYQRINIELIGNIANLFSRLTGFVHRFYGGVLPTPTDLEIGAHTSDEPPNEASTPVFNAEDAETQIQRVIQEYTECFEKTEIRAAIRRACALSDMGNKLFQKHEPWKSASSPATRQLVSVLAQLARNLAIMLSPFLPDTAARAAHQLGIQEALHWKMLEWPPPTGAIAKPQILLKRLEEEQIDALRMRYGPSAPRGAPLSPAQRFDATVRLVAARITEVTAHPSADRLYVEAIDDGSGVDRQIVSGLVRHYTPEELQGRTVVIVDNLKPATLRGVESQGMLLAASDDEGTLEVLTVEAAPGTPIALHASRQLANPKTLTIDDFVATPIVVQEHAVLVDGQPLLCQGKPLTVANIATGTVE